jgi:hypothetical protein
MFQLTAEEFTNSRFHSGTSSLRSQIDTSGWGGRRYPPYAFIEQGVAMLSSVLHSARAIHVNIKIMRSLRVAAADICFPASGRLNQRFLSVLWR